LFPSHVIGEKDDDVWPRAVSLCGCATLRPKAPSRGRLLIK
jgi:hypothetical protein